MYACGWYSGKEECESEPTEDTNQVLQANQQPVWFGELGTDTLTLNH